jgi:hypothetical protein
MADYYQLKNQNIFNPPANTSLGNSTNQFGNAFVQNDLILGNVTVTGSTINTPKVSTIGYPGDDTAADPAGGQTITLTGSGFLVGASVLINGSAVGVVSVVSSTTITFTSPANSAGSYVLYVINTDGGTAIAIPGIQYSGIPTWSTAAGSLGNVYETANFNSTVTATGDAPITYSVFSGSIPPGATFNSNGTITGTSELLSSPTTYTFTVRATDAELQDTNRTFSLTINPDVVTWNSPANNTTYTQSTNVAISNVTLSATSAVGSGITYTANSLPDGLSLTGANISGTPTVAANSSSLLTATANTTSESSAITINWVISVANDIYFEYNTLLIPGASTTFVDDASTNNFAVTINGDTRPNSFNPYTPGYYSNYFNGSSSLSAPSNAAFDFGTGDLTIECWIYVSSVSTSYQSVFQFGDAATTAGFHFLVNTNTICLRTNGSQPLTTSGTIFANTWNHIAITRASSTTKIFINGTTSGGTYNWTASLSSGTARLIGADTYSNPVTGYISNARVVKGTAVYTSNFTPSTTPLTAIANTSLLTCQSNRFIDNSTNNFTLTVAGNTTINSFDPFVPNSSYSSYGSGYFDGTGDYLSVASNAAFNVSSNNVTAEAWVYLTSFNTSGSPFISTIWSLDSSGSNNTFSYIYNTGSIAVGINGVNEIASSAGVILLNTWYHTAVVRNGSTTTIYVNGTSVASNTTSVWANTGSRPFLVGSTSQSANYYLTGYISNVRFVNGTAVYTSAFTPPTEPLTAIANTSLLTLQNNQSVNNNVFLDNSTNNFLVTRNGNTTQGTFSPYGANWSNYFDGTGDYLSSSVGTTLNVSANTNFTVEGWCYLGSLTSSRPAIFSNYNSFTTGGLAFFAGHGASTTTQFQVALNGTFPALNAGTIPYGSWFHWAIVRNGTSSNNITVYINGISIGTISSNVAITSTGNSLWLGASGDSTASAGINGYMSNFRWVNGTAVYTSNFTPPTTPLTAISGTSLLTCADNRLIDDSVNNLTITKTGDVSVQRFSPFNPSILTPTSYSGYFDGNGDYLTVPSNTGFALSTVDFTIECWVYYVPGGSGDRFIVDNGNGNFLLRYAGATTLQFYAQGNLRLTYAVTLTNTWTHIAVVRSGTTYTLYTNGVSRNTSTGTDNITNSSAIGIGGLSSGGDYFSGYISNVRIVKGTAVYTSSFTPSTTPLTAISGTSLLTLQSPTFVDNSTNNFTITAFGNSRPTPQNPFGFTSATTEGYTTSTIGGSAYFDGTGDYLTIPDSPVSEPGSNNFTLDCWYYMNSDTGYLIGKRNPASANYGIFQIAVYPSGGSILGVLEGGSPWNLNLSFTATTPLYTWNHLAFVRLGNVYTVYINGVNSGTTTLSGALNNSNYNWVVGAYQSDGTGAFNGYISDMRFVNGTALYTSNFVPTTQPLTAVQNTSFLLNMTSAGIYDASMMTTMESRGDAKLSTAISKFGESSMYFDGTGDYLISPQYLNFDFGTSDFTIELWMYVTSLPVNTYSQMVCFGTGSSSQRWILSFDTQTSQSAPYIRFISINSGGSVVINVPGAGSSGWSANTWYHIAVTRSGNTFKLFRNGVQNGATVTNSGSCPATTSTGALYVGSEVGGGESYYNGYIDDLRITKGYARYTSNFTPPTTAFPTY